MSDSLDQTFDAEHGIRVARPDEYDALRVIEDCGDAMFLDIGIGPFQWSEADDHLPSAAVVLVAGEPPVGFACVELVDDAAHLWQLSVHPGAGRRGLGTSLVEAVCRWAAERGLPAVTLTTYRDVPWNGPFYGRLGFREIDELTPGLAYIRQHERAIGDDDFGPRIAMRKALAGTA